MQLHVLSGASMTGKTTWIEHMLLHAGLPVHSTNPELAGMLPSAPERTLRIGGSYTPAIFENGAKAGIEAVLLPNCERFAHATRRAEAGPEPAGSGVEDAAHTGNPRQGWDFDEGALARVNAHFADCANCDLLVVDELGPLELVLGEGCAEALKLMDTDAVSQVLAVIRPALLDAARERWGDFELLGTDTDAENLLDTLRA